MKPYQIHDITEKELKFGYWFLMHREQFKKALLIAIILICVIFWGMAIYGFTVYLIDLPQDKEIISGLIRTNIDFEGFREKTKPLDLQITEPQVIYTGSNKYDFVAQAVNPNEKRGVTKLEYQFVSGSYVSPTSSIVILPGQKVYLLSLANESKKRLSEANLKIVNLGWQSLRDKTEFPDSIIEIEEIDFFTAKDGSRSWATFTAHNQTLKNYWEVTFQAVLFGSRKIVGVNQITAEEFLAQESREIEMSWFEKLPRFNKVEVIPIVNVYDEGIYFEVPGEATEL